MADRSVTRDDRDENRRAPRALNPVRKGLVELHRARHNVLRLRHKPAPGHPSPYTSELLEGVTQAHQNARKAEDAFGEHLLRSIRSTQKRTWLGPHGRVTSNLAHLLENVGGAVFQLIDAQDRIARALGAVWEAENAAAGQEGMNAPEHAPQ